MAGIKQIFWLIRFEMKHSLKYYGLLVLFLGVLFLLIRPLVSDYFDKASMGLDFFFVLSFTLFPWIARPKQFQLQKIKSIHYYTPFIVMLNELPVPKKVIVQYRFALYLIPFSLFNGLLMLMLYPSFAGYMTVPTYIVFAVIWFAFGIYVGCISPAFEVYANLGWNIFYGLIFGFGLFIFYIVAFYKWYQSGLVSWTVHMAANFPVMTLVFSIILAILGLFLWMHVMEQRMTKKDYL